MIPFIRSLSELMALTESRDRQKVCSENNTISLSKVYSEKNKKYLNSFEKKELDLPNLPKNIRHKWIQNKNTFSKFIDDLDYNNQILSSYDLTLIEGQNKRNQHDAA